MDDLLKDAIADAKAVRETALANAKIALEEAFTPRIQSMLSDKIQSEIEDNDEGDYNEEEEMEKGRKGGPKGRTVWWLTIFFQMTRRPIVSQN